MNRVVHCGMMDPARSPMPAAHPSPSSIGVP